MPKEKRIEISRSTALVSIGCMGEMGCDLGDDILHRILTGEFVEVSKVILILFPIPPPPPENIEWPILSLENISAFNQLIIICARERSNSKQFTLELG